MNEAQTELKCPKCQGPMRSYERNGVVVDQCQECRGVFLDRGELEKLIEAESAFMADSRQGSQRQPDERGFGGFGGGHGGGHGGHGRRKKGGFLGELFD